jgi:malate dehydrogenase (oxaloacetate-decarboxylating)(NADP+)
MCTGVGMGILISSCTKLRDEQFIAAAEAVARMVTPEDLSRGALFPPISRIRETSALVAQAVALKAYQGGYATALPKPHNLLELIKYAMYNPQYRLYR